MFLGFFDSIMDVVNVPLGIVLKAIFWLLGNYGWSIILFAFLSRLIMLPSSINGHKNQLRMRSIQPKMKKLAEKYHNNSRDPKYQEELQQLYASEGYNPMSGCLPTLIQFPLIFGLWNVIRQPITYMFNFTGEALYKTADILITHGAENPAVQRLISHLTKVNADFVVDGVLAEKSGDLVKALKTSEIYLADAVNAGLDTLHLDGLREILEDSQMLIKTDMIQTEFFGINLGDSAQAQEGFWSWFLLVPVIAAATSFLVSFVSMRMNRAKGDNNDPTAKSMNTMMYMMPLLSLWIGYTMNFGVALYWISSNLFSLLQTVLLPVFLKEKPVEKPVKEKKLNHTQIEKMKRDEALLNGEVENKKKK